MYAVKGKTWWGGIGTLTHFQTNGNHATELSTAGHVISKWHWKSTFDFSEIANNYGLKRGTVCQIVKFIFHFSLKLYIQYWKYFHSMALGSLGSGYIKKIGQHFWLGCLSAFKDITAKTTQIV